MVSALTPITMGIQSPNVGDEMLRSMAQGQNIRAQGLVNQARQQDIGETNYQASLRNLQIINRLANQVRQLPPEQRQSYVSSLDRNMLQSIGISASDLEGQQLDDASLDQLISQTGAVLQGASGGQSQTDIQQAQYVEGLGYIQQLRNGQVTMQELTPDQQAKVKQALDAQANRQAQAYGLKVGAGLDVRSEKEPSLKADITKAEQEVILATDPAIKSAVESAVLESKRIADNTKLSNSNAKALSVYDTAMKHFNNAMEKPWTGPIVGLMPALTSDARTADGAVSAMAPILKDIFRTAGEGTFTDADQKMLLNMLPTRQDDAASRKSKLEMIDSIIRAKLSPMDSVGGSGQGANTTGINGGVSVDDLVNQYAD